MEPKRTLRVVTYNIRHGVGNDPEDPAVLGEQDLRRVADVIRLARPDIVALQEVDRFNPRSRREDQPAVLGEMLGMESCFGRNVKYDQGEYGCAILSRFPIESFDNTTLPTTAGWEVRGLLEATIRLPGGAPLRVLNTHLQVGHPDTESAAAAERHDQASVVAERLATADVPLVLMGDFNAEPGDPVLRPFECLTDAWTSAGDGGPGFTIPSHPAATPEVRIDVIYVNDRLQVDSAAVFTEGAAPFASDHLPVVADLSL